MQGTRPRKQNQRDGRERLVCEEVAFEAWISQKEQNTARNWRNWPGRALSPKGHRLGTERVTLSQRKGKGMLL